MVAQTSDDGGIEVVVVKTWVVEFLVVTVEVVLGNGVETVELVVVTAGVVKTVLLENGVKTVELVVVTAGVVKTVLLLLENGVEAVLV